jgi:hypothetical protein
MIRPSLQSITITCLLAYLRTHALLTHSCTHLLLYLHSLYTQQSIRQKLFISKNFTKPNIENYLKPDEDEDGSAGSSDASADVGFPTKTVTSRRSNTLPSLATMNLNTPQALSKQSPSSIDNVMKRSPPTTMKKLNNTHFTLTTFSRFFY